MKSKTVIAFLTAMTMTMGAMGVTAYAEEPPRRYTYGELNNKEYNEYIRNRNLTISKNEERLIELYRQFLERDSAGGELIHVYVSSRRMFFELAYSDNSREFRIGFFMNLTSDVEITANKEEIDEFLSANNLQGEVGISSDRMRMGVTFKPDENRSYDEVINTHFALADKYSLKTDLSLLDDAGKIFNDEGTLNSAILKGDADLSGYVDLADLTTVAKYNLNNEEYPLANETAYANADMNSDGKVDGLDTSALIENQLGK